MVATSGDMGDIAFEPDVFNLSAFTVGADPEVTRGRLVSKEPGVGAFAWPEIEPWMRHARLVTLQVAVHFGGSTPTMAQWIDEGGRRLWVDVAAERPAEGGAVAWGLALIRNCDVVLRALSRYFGIDPAPLVPRTVEEAALEAAGSEPIPRDVTLVVLPERVKPASRVRVWEALELLVRNDMPAFHQRWRDLDGASLVALQAAASGRSIAGSGRRDW